jgi:DNA-binding HxlR family transcriptional regulator
MPKDTEELVTNFETCPIRNVLHQVGDKWSLLVMLTLADRKLRFMELKRMIGDITQRVLTQTLRNLERDGYIARKVYPTSPQTVEYWLTPLGKSLLTPMSSLLSWANSHFSEVVKARTSYDQKTSTGEPLSLT